LKNYIETTSDDGTGPIIPDFEEDAQTIAEYNDGLALYEHLEASDAEARTRAVFAKKRDAIRAEIAVAESILEERKVKAQKALRAYANLYPHRMDRIKPLKPSFWDMLFSLGWAGGMFKRTVNTAAEVEQARNLRRRMEQNEVELEQQLKRALYLEADAIKKKFEGPERIAAFHAQPGIELLHKRVEEIQAERNGYADRLERGAVPPTEQRDREFAQHKVSQLEAPFAGVTIVRVARYGSLTSSRDSTYFILRDLEGKLYHLAYDPRLEPLIERVVDAYQLADSCEVGFSCGADGRPMTVAEHYAANFKDEEVARSEYSQARMALRAPRADFPPMTSVETEGHLDLMADVARAAEEQLIELLATLAQSIGPDAMAASGKYTIT